MDVNELLHLLQTDEVTFNVEIDRARREPTSKERAMALAFLAFVRASAEARTSGKILPEDRRHGLLMHSTSPVDEAAKRLLLEYRTDFMHTRQTNMDELEAKLTSKAQAEVNLAIEEIARFTTTEQLQLHSIDDASHLLHGLDEVGVRLIEAGKHFAKPRLQAILDAVAGKSFETAEENRRFVTQLNHVRKLLGLNFHLVNPDGTAGEKVNLVHSPNSRRGVFRATRTTAAPAHKDRIVSTTALFPKLTLDYN